MHERQLYRGGVRGDCLRRVLAVLLVTWLPVRAQEVPVADHWWSAQTAQALVRAGSNSPALLQALGQASTTQRESLQFLLENMPDQDLRDLSAADLLQNVADAITDLEQSPWSQTIPLEIFLNDLLPYVNASERREPWRAQMRSLCLPLVAGCQTPAAAAQRLNETLFDALKVHYSTARARADQSPSETIASGTASCTGLSILLVDACRSVGVPARLVGIPDWSDGRGNHTWVEIWEADKWHFLGAAEPDKRGLDHAWFERDASLAQRDSPRHAIYAVSFHRTPLPFPLAWGPDSGGISAENVTDRYAVEPLASAQAASPTTRVLVCVRTRQDGPRVAAAVQVRGVTTPDLALSGVSKDESADTNDLLAFDLPKQQEFVLTAMVGDKLARVKISGGSEDQAVVELVPDPPAEDTPPATPVAPDVASLLTASAPLHDALANFFAASTAQQAGWQFDPQLDKILRENPVMVRRAAWEAYRQSAAPGFAADFGAKRVRFGKYVSPYTVRAVGQKPPGGWGLVIAMHGGGGAPKEVNDSQWRIMQVYYHDQPQLGGYLYVALRAPNDTWNGFYDDYVYPLITNLIRQMAVCEDVNCDKVFLIGYSHGGYGAFAIGPKMSDRFAAIHSSAAAPTDGQISPKTLRNTPFDFTVGEFDDNYGRRERCEAFARQIQELRGDRTDIFPVKFTLEPGRHHSDLPDRDQLGAMLAFTRNPVPRELTWVETDGVIKNFYWLEDQHPGKTHELDATCQDNHLKVTAQSSTGSFAVLLDERLVNFNKPISVEINGRILSALAGPSLSTLCQTLTTRGDPEMAFSCRLNFEADAKGRLDLRQDVPKEK